MSLGSKSSGREAEEGGCGSGCKTTGGGVNGASVVRVTAGAGTSPSRRNGIASWLFSSGRLSDMGGGRRSGVQLDRGKGSWATGDGVGGMVVTRVTAGAGGSPSRRN